MRWSFVPIFVCLPLFVLAQNVTGTWKGKLTQVPGGMLILYDFEMHLSQVGNNVTGYSLVSNPRSPEFRAKILLNGTFDGIFFTFRETKIEEENAPASYYWCIKRGALLFKRGPQKHRLSGKWESANCPTGEMVLERTDRAKPKETPTKAVTVAQKKSPTEEQKIQSSTIGGAARDSIPAPITNFAAADQGKAIVLEQVQFAQSLGELLPEAYPQLNALAAHLLANPTLKIEVGGHTDNVGSAYKNVQLSLQRAERVVQYLIQKGVAKARLIPHGYGGGQPLAPNNSEENRKKNRRVEFKLLK